MRSKLERIGRDGKFERRESDSAPLLWAEEFGWVFFDIRV